MSTTFPMTKEGKQKLEEELDQLLKVEREAIKKAISEARALGDLKENSEYHAAKEKQSLIEGRIQELHGKLNSAQVVDINLLKGTSSIKFGATVSLFDTEKNKSIKYQIVGIDEADIKSGKISFTSPLAAALIGKSEGDTILVNAPKGKIEYEIESVEYL